MTAHRLPDNRVPVLLSAHERDLIGQDAAAILDYLEHLAGAEDPTTPVAATLLGTRRLRRHRAVVRAADRSELEAGLRALAGGEHHPLVARSTGSSGARTAFVFPGQGNQWPSMGAEAYHRLPAYRTEADRCAETFAAAGLPSPLTYLLSDTARDWSQIDIQGAQFTHAASLAQLWRSCGVVPDITLGHSLGEVAAAYVAGAVALPDAVAVVAARAAVVDRLPGRYGMAVLGVGADHTERLIAETPGWLEISAVNSPSSSVVSGDRDAVAGIVRLAQKDSIFVRELDVEYPGHTSKLESLRGTLGDLLPASAFRDAPIEFVSSARGGVVGAGTDFTDYWYQNLRNVVRFVDAAATAVQRGAGAFVEMSAHPSLLYALDELAEDAVIVGSGRRDESVVEQLSANIVTAALANPGYRWSDLVSFDDQPLLRAFPTAPMREVHLWATPEPLPPAPGSVVAALYEEWEPRPEVQPAAADRPPCGVVVAAPEPDDAVARQLSEAVAADPRCELTDTDEAEVAVVVAPALTRPDVLDTADEFRSGAWRIDYRRAIGPRCRRAWLVTRCGERVGSDPSGASPAQAALAAAHRSVGFEFPDCTFAHLDLPAWGLDAQSAHGCVDALLGDHTEVALRDGDAGGPGWFVRTLRECAEPASERLLDTAALDDVVITGGNGTIGLRYARHCVEQGARRVTLLSRTGIERGQLDRLSDGYHAEVHAPACDITDAATLSAVAGEYAGNGASLLIHAAGAARFAPHDQLTDDDLADVFSAKVAGLVAMTDVWPLRQDARILLCSSVSGVWGGYGHAAYAASNRVLDVFAAQLRAKGLDCMAVRWGLWRGTAIADAEEIARIERSGLVAMDPDAAVIASLCHHRGDPLILAADFDRLRVFFESQGAAAPFAVAGTDREAEVAGDDESPDGRPVDEVVRGALAATLSLDGPESVDLSARLVDLGMDSLLGVDLRDQLRRGIGRSVSLGRMLGGMTGVELVEALRPAPGADGQTPDAGPTVQPERSERLESSRD